MKIGQTEKGTNYPICRFSECLSPIPKISITDQMVVDLFRECQTQWSYLSGLGGAVKIGIPFTELEIAADAFEIPLSEDILIKFNRCVRFIKSQEAENEKRKGKGKK